MHPLYRLVFFTALFVLPSLSHAAGFASQSIFLSRSSVTEGETVIVHVIVENNDATTKFSGSLTLAEGEHQIGTVPVTLAAGEADVASVSWKPAAGSRTVSATLTDSTGTVVEQDKAFFTIAAKPAATATPVADTSAPIQKAIAEVSPAVAAGSAPVFNTIDSLRQNSLDFVTKQLADTKAKLPGVTLGAAAEKPSTQKTDWSLGTIVRTIYFYILTIISAILAKAAFFYPVFAFLFFWGLWKLYQRMRRPQFPY